MRRIVREDRVDLLLRVAAEHPNPKLRRSALADLSIPPEGAELTLLLACLGDENDRVRAQVVQCLGTVESPEVVVALSAAVGEESNEQVLRAMVRRLGEIAAPESLEALVELAAAGRGPSDDVTTALAALGPLVLPALAEIVRTGEQAPYTVLETLVKLGGVDTVPLLLQIARRGDVAGASVAKALKAFPEDRSAIPVLAEMLRTGPQWEGSLLRTAELAAAALEARGWAPDRLEDKVHYAIVRRDWVVLGELGEEAWPEAMAVLGAAVRRRSPSADARLIRELTQGLRTSGFVPARDPAHLPWWAAVQDHEALGAAMPDAVPLIHELLSVNCQYHWISPHFATGLIGVLGSAARPGDIDVLLDVRGPDSVMQVAVDVLADLPLLENQRVNLQALRKGLKKRAAAKESAANNRWINEQLAESDKGR